MEDRAIPPYQEWDRKMGDNPCPGSEHTVGGPNDHVAGAIGTGVPVHAGDLHRLPLLPSHQAGLLGYLPVFQLADQIIHCVGVVVGQDPLRVWCCR